MDDAQKISPTPSLPSFNNADFLATQRPFKGRYGTELYVVDKETRLAVPDAYKPLLQYGGVVTVGLDENLLLFSNKHWELITKMLAQQAGDAPGGATLVRHIYGRHVEFEALNEDGSITLTQDLINYARLNKKVVMVGLIYYAEVHRDDHFNDSLLSADDAAKLAQALSL